MCRDGGMGGIEAHAVQSKPRAWSVVLENPMLKDHNSQLKTPTCGFLTENL